MLLQTASGLQTSAQALGGLQQTDWADPGMHSSQDLHNKHLDADEQQPELITTQELEAALEYKRWEADMAVNPALREACVIL